MAMDREDKRMMFVLNGVWVFLLICGGIGLPYGVYPPFLIVLSFGVIGWVIGFFVWLSGKVFPKE